jgi:uncharacterized repeat protein (TIGR03803 family)
MTTFALRRYAFSLSASCALLAGCGGLQPPIGAPVAMTRSAVTGERVSPDRHDYRVLYGFKGTRNGRAPTASLVVVNKTLYGTTEFGGTGSCDYTFDPGCGTIFAVNPSGREHVLYSFKGGKDGQSPFGDLISVNGHLYGTTVYGGGSSICYGSSGNFGCGTVFEVTTSGKERVLYRLPGYPHAYEPYSGVTFANDTLFGTTIYGGTSDAGTVYALHLAGGARIIHSFKGGRDGALPFASLTLVNGALYGTTSQGGLTSGCNDSGCGTVFAVSASGKERVLHRFGVGSDGVSPIAGLTDVNGTLYGTTVGGGAYDKGTVFAITTSGHESVLYSFTGTLDGAAPDAGLTDVNGTLYGAASAGGVHGDGTVFAITTSGAETTLHSFKGGEDGKGPNANLLYHNGSLYGTTSGGGAAGLGTVFRISP